MLHDEIKTYKISDENSGIAFKIKRMEDIHAAMNGEVDRPHRHDYYTIIFIEQAKGVHYIDFKKYDVFPRSIFFLSPGQVHQFFTDDEPQGWVLLFTQEFLLQNNIRNNFINDVYLLEDYGETPPLPVSEHQYNDYQEILNQLAEYDKRDMQYKYEAIGALLKLFLIQSNNACSLHKESNPQTVEVGNHTLRNFKTLLEKEFASMHKVGEYANQLAITPDHLNKTVKSLTGKSAKELIQHKIIVEAKRNLLFSEISTKELSFQLGFEEPAHFSNFFKKHTGQTPSKFKSEARTN